MGRSRKICKCEIVRKTHFDITVWNNDREQNKAQTVLLFQQKSNWVADLQIALHHNDVHLECVVCLCVSVKTVDLATTLKLFCSRLRVTASKKELPRGQCVFVQPSELSILVRVSLRVSVWFLYEPSHSPCMTTLYTVNLSRPLSVPL